jgi:NADH:ubiquinone oxidoreductase subunit F (NADH-binding)
LAAHLARWGQLSRPTRPLIDDVEASDLTGRGGACFPVATKWRSVAGGRRRPVVVANGAESEPASRKDALLLTSAPHLVLDGLSLTALALHATRAAIYAPDHVMPAVTAALAERGAGGIGGPEVEVVRTPDTYLAGQESAVVAALEGRRIAVPSFTGIRSIRDRGVGGRPTLVQNVETLAHVAMIARFGPEWFRSVGTTTNPGSTLITLTRRPSCLVLEAPLGTNLVDATGITSQELARAPGVLLGGYGGAWVTTQTVAGLPLSEREVRRAGATLGPGIVALLDQDTCPLAEMADVVRFLQRQGAGQCGPCVSGLAELADDMDRLAYGAADSGLVDRALRTCALIEGRGACRHPDGVARFVASGLEIFAPEVVDHLHRGPCPRTRAARILPLPHHRRGRLLARS